MHHKLLSWVFLVGFCFGFTNHVFAQGSLPGRIVLARVNGEVTVTDKATHTASVAVNNLAITAGTIISTGKAGGVVLVFSNGSTINLGEDSVLDIEAFLQDPFEAADLKVAEMTAEPSTSTTKLNLTRGELVGNVKKLSKDSSFIVQTPVGAAGIRGTTFRIVFRPDPVNPNRVLFSVSTLEGLVEVQLQGAADTAVPVADNREVVVELDVTIDAITGAMTVTTPPQIVTQDIAPQTQAAISSAIQAIIEAVQDIVITSPTTSGGGNGSTGPAGETTETADTSDTSDDTESSQPMSESAAEDTTSTETETTDTVTADTPRPQTEAPLPPPPPIPPPPRTTTGDGGAG